MTNTTIILALILAGVLVTWAIAALQRKKADALAERLRQEWQASLAAQTQNVTTLLGQLTQLITQQLGHVRQELQRGVADSGTLATEAQRHVAEQLRTSTQALARLAEQLGQMQQSGRELSQAAQTLQTVLSGAKTRGALGEVALEGLLADALPRSGFQMQYRFKTGAVVDAIVRTGEKIVCIDSKFPLEAYRRLVETGEEARKEFAHAVRKHAECIAEKYVLPDEDTLDIALMFVPSEGVYYELLMTADSKGRLDDYCRTISVMPVSPNSLHAYLSSILIGMNGLQIETNARRLLGSLTGLKKQLDDFAGIYERLGRHLHNAQQSFAEAENKLEHTRGVLEQMAQGALPETPVKALEAVSND